ncbi:MAG: hypothetical protein IPH82_19755 [Chloroflexi bacterium]|nr:hypothetical protein [Chloroflexota bacterium]
MHIIIGVAEAAVSVFSAVAVTLTAVMVGSFVTGTVTVMINVVLAIVFSGVIAGGVGV